MPEAFGGFDWDDGYRAKCQMQGVALEAIRRDKERSIPMKKPLPVLNSDEEAEEFVANSDLTDYDLSDFKIVKFEFQPKSERVNMRLPKPLLDAVKASASRAGVPYQRYIRQVLETAVRE